MDNDYSENASHKEKIKWLKKNQIEIKKYPISFSLDWKGWKLMNERPLIVPDGYKNIDKCIKDSKDFQYKIVSRAGSKPLSEYLFMFATEEDEPQIPFFMLNREEIQKAYKTFADRVDIDLPSSSIIFSLDGGVRYKMYHYQIEKRKSNPGRNFRNDIVSVYIKDLLPRSIYYGDFDPDPLIAVRNGRVRLVVSRDIPRWHKKASKGRQMDSRSSESL